MKVADLSTDLKKQLNLTNEINGVMVNSIAESSNAYDRGLRKGDIITAVKRKNIVSAKEFYEEVESSAEKGDQAVLLTIERGNMKQFIAFRL